MLAFLYQDLLYLEFDSSEEAKWVMENDSRIFRGDVMHLEWWNPSVGCASRKNQVKESEW